MNVFAWILVGYFVLNAVLYIAFIGRPNKMRFTGGTALLALVTYSFLIWLVFQAVAA